MLAPTAREESKLATLTHRPARSGSVIAATWLIGLGLVFLFQRALDLAWGEAWPMFVMLAGVGSLVSVLLGMRERRSLFAALAWPVGLIVIGTLLLLSTTGSLGMEPGQLVANWWPVALIAWGAWLLLAAALPGRRIGVDTLSLPLAGAAAASVKITFGGGELSVGPGAASTLSGTFAGMPAKYRTGADGTIAIEPEAPAGWPWLDRTPSWQIGLPKDMPVSLQVESGAAKTTLDLDEVRLQALRIATGASDTRVRLPRSAGQTRVKAEGGAAAIVFEVPAGVAARIHSRMALGSTQVDESRFPRVGDGWETPDYTTATNRVEIEIQGGVGSARVVSGG
jgi:hypothetical protein